jgi:ABC-type phosphate transport system substrate-binding protein
MHMFTKFRGKAAVGIAVTGLLCSFAIAAGALTTSQDVKFTNAQATQDKLYFGGSSFDQPFFDQTIPAFMTEGSNSHITGVDAPNMDVNIQLYDTVGSTAGKKGVVGSLASSADNFVGGATDVPMGTIVNNTQTRTLTCLDSYLVSGSCSVADESANLANYVQVPVVEGGVGMYYNEHQINTLEGTTVVNHVHVQNQITLNAATIAGIYDGTITNWDNLAIAQLNKTKLCRTLHNGNCTVSKVTSETISPVYRADGSGTSYIFMNYLNATVGANFKYSAPGCTSDCEIFPSTSFPTANVNPNAIGAQKNAGVALDVETIAGGIGYVEYNYIRSATLPTAKLINHSGATVTLNAASVAADAGSTVPHELNGYVTGFSIVNGTAAGAWPISGFSWLVIPRDTNGRTAGGTSISANDALVVARYADWATQLGTTSAPGGQHFAALEGYVPFGTALVAFAHTEVDQLKYNGSVLI